MIDTTIYDFAHDPALSKPIQQFLKALFEDDDAPLRTQPVTKLSITFNNK